jgi:hypothetical protein
VVVNRPRADWSGDPPVLILRLSDRLPLVACDVDGFKETYDSGATPTSIPTGCAWGRISSDHRAASRQCSIRPFSLTGGAVPEPVTCAMLFLGLVL